MAAVSMVALNCSANMFGLSKTEVDVFVVTNCPFGWGRITRQSKIVLENDVSQLTMSAMRGIYVIEASEGSITTQFKKGRLPGRSFRFLVLCGAASFCGGLPARGSSGDLCDPLLRKAQYNGYGALGGPRLQRSKDGRITVYSLSQVTLEVMQSVDFNLASRLGFSLVLCSLRLPVLFAVALQAMIAAKHGASRRTKLDGYPFRAHRRPEPKQRCVRLRRPAAPISQSHDARAVPAKFRAQCPRQRH